MKPLGNLIYDNIVKVAHPIKPYGFRFLDLGCKIPHDFHFMHAVLEEEESFEFDSYVGIDKENYSEATEFDYASPSEDLFKEHFKTIEIDELCFVYSHSKSTVYQAYLQSIKVLNCIKDREGLKRVTALEPNGYRSKFNIKGGQDINNLDIASLIKSENINFLVLSNILHFTDINVSRLISQLASASEGLDYIYLEYLFHVPKDPIYTHHKSVCEEDICTLKTQYRSIFEFSSKSKRYFLGEKIQSMQK